MILYCLIGTGLCISPEAWAGWAQAFGAVVAVVGTALAVQRTHRLQVAADRARETRQWAAEVESLERLFGEVLMRFMKAQSAAVNFAVFSEYLDDPQSGPELREIGQALDICRATQPIRPHLLLQFVRACNAAEVARGSLAEAIRTRGYANLLDLGSLGEAVSIAVEDLERIVRDLRDSREGYEKLASQQTA